VWKHDWPRVMRHCIQAALAHGAVLAFFDNVYSYGPLPLAVPLREDHPRQPPSRKGAVRAGLLRQLHEAGERDGLRWVVGRSADFYGPGALNTLLYASAMERQLNGRRARWLGKPDALHSFTYTGDAARGLVRLAQDAGAWQQEWHLPTASPAPTPRELLAISARLLGAPEGVQPMPDALLRLLKPFVPILREVDEMLYQNRQDYVFDSSRFMARCPDFAITPYAEGIAAMVASLRTPA
jgi:nucleoside-diphosphate-sugar epimerase